MGIFFVLSLTLEICKTHWIKMPSVNFFHMPSKQENTDVHFLQSDHRYSQIQKQCRRKQSKETENITQLHISRQINEPMQRKPHSIWKAFLLNTDIKRFSSLYSSLSGNCPHQERGSNLVKMNYSCRVKCVYVCVCMYVCDWNLHFVLSVRIFKKM